MHETRNVVLIIDDTPENVRILGELLENSGYEVRIASDGPMGLEIALSGGVDLILLDIMMPGMDGYEVCRQLKRDKSSKDIPVIFLTALDSFDDEAKGLGLGAVDYITKPFKLGLVKSRVSNHLALRNAQLELLRYNDQLETMVKDRTAELLAAHRRLLNVDSANADFLRLMYQKLWSPQSGLVDLTQAAFQLLEGGDSRNLELRERFENAQAQFFELVNNALLLAGAHGGGVNPKLHPIVLQNLVSGIVVNKKDEALAKQLGFDMQIPDSEIVAGDIDLLNQVLATVCQTAITLARPKTNIFIRTVKRRDAIQLSFSTVGNLLESSDTIASLFALPEGKSLNLTYPLAAKLILAMGGELNLVEKPGVGMELQLSLKTLNQKKGVTIALKP